MPTVLIVGANRGIGLGLVSEYVARGWDVHATTRTTSDPGMLGQIEGTVTLHQLDVLSSSDLLTLVDDLRGVAVDVLIHNAGVNNTDRNTLMAVNAVAPVAITEALLDNVAASDQRKIGWITSQMGARCGRQGSLGGYGDSKAALNDSFRDLVPAWESRGVSAVAIHPGWVRTDMGGDSASISIKESALGILNVMEQLSPSTNGRFVTWENRAHDW